MEGATGAAWAAREMLLFGGVFGGASGREELTDTPSLERYHFKYGRLCGDVDDSLEWSKSVGVYY